MLNDILKMLNDILIAKIAWETDISEEQLRSHPMLWDCLDDDETSLQETIEYMEELAYRGELQFSWALTN